MKFNSHVAWLIPMEIPMLAKNSKYINYMLAKTLNSIPMLAKNNLFI